MKRIIAIITITTYTFLAIMFPIPHVAFAQLEGTPFGGFDVWELPCTCDQGLLWFHIFVPLWILGEQLPGILTAPVTPVAFTVYYLHPESWDLGTEEPGAGTACAVGYEPYCVPVPNYGTITPFTGVSVSGVP